MAERLLPGVLSLKGVNDVEAIARVALRERLRRSDIRLSRDDFDDALADVIRDVWFDLEHRYDPARGLSPASYATWRAQCAVTEHFRARFGRNGQRLAPGGVVSLSELERDGRIDELDRLLGSEPASGDDSSDPRAAALRGLHTGGDRADDPRVRASFLRLASRPKGIAVLLDELRQELEQAAA